MSNPFNEEQPIIDWLERHTYEDANSDYDDDDLLSGIGWDDE